MTCKCGCAMTVVHVHIRSNFHSAPEKVVSWWKLSVNQHRPLETGVRPTVSVSLMFCCAARLGCFWQIVIFLIGVFWFKCLIFYACHMFCWGNGENIWLLAPAVHNVSLPWGVGPPEWQPGPRFPEKNSSRKHGQILYLSPSYRNYHYLQRFWDLSPFVPLIPLNHPWNFKLKLLFMRMVFKKPRKVWRDHSAFFFFFFFFYNKMFLTFFLFLTLPTR